MAVMSGTVSGAGREIRGYSSASYSSWTQHRGKKTKSELEVLAQRYGWQPREFTLAELHKMSADEILYREAFDQEHLQFAYDEPSRKKQEEEQRADAEKKRADKIWNGEISDEVIRARNAVCHESCSQHPQYIDRHQQNNLKMANYMIKNH